MASQIAEVAIPISIALDEQFDYLIPQALDPPLSVGCRVLVPFRTSVVLGYVHRLKDHSAYEKVLKPIIKNLDSTPVLSPSLFHLAHKIRDDYFCSLADAIQAVMPSGIKKSKKGISIALEQNREDQPFSPLEFKKEESDFLAKKESLSDVLLIQDFSNTKRWAAYAALIKKTLNAKKSVIFLVPDHRKIDTALHDLDASLKPIVMSSSLKPQESLKNWMRIRQAESCFVVGTRSAIFSPAQNLGLIIIEEEEHFAYRQDQVPHYHAADIAFLKAKKARVQIVFGSATPSLETYALSKVTHIPFPPALNLASVQWIGTRQEFRLKGRPKIISRILEHHIAECLGQKGRILLFSHKKGFSTFLYCQKCKTTLTCPRCSSSLRYSYQEKQLTCPTCAFKTPPQELCPRCRSAYVKYAGYGLEKIESEIHHLFPTASITVYDPNKPQAADYDIILATQDFLENPRWFRETFQTVGIIGCEQMLGQIDFRSTERTFGRLWKLLLLAKKEMLIQSQVIDHDALTFLAKHDPEGFYRYEWTQRKELKLPPVMKLATLEVRGKNQNKTRQAVELIYKKLKKIIRSQKNVESYEPVPSIPFKKRGNYWYHIFIKYKKIEPLRKVIWLFIRQRKRGVIVTLDPLS